MRYYKVEDVINTLADQWHYEATMEYPDTAGGIEDWKENARELFADLPTIEVSEDCISREYILGEAFASDEYNRETKSFDLPVVSVRDIEDAPSVVPSCQKNRQVERAEGEWYRQTTDHFDYWEYSECGMGVGLDDIKNYCPNCGAKMKGADNE